MDYNTQRKKMVLPEYGRNIQNMVDYAITVEDRDRRNKMAKEIIQIMGNIKPQYREISDFKHKLWDHLAIMSDFELDIDYPYELPKKDTFYEKPNTVPYAIHDIKYKHYGHGIELLIKKAIEMEPGDRKEKLIVLIANHMKKLYLTWNKDSVTDDVIIDDLKELSGGKLALSDKKLTDSREIINKSKRRKNFRKK